MFPQKSKDSPSSTACRSLWCCLPRRACPALGDDSALWPAICPLLPTPITALKYDRRNILKTWHLPLTGSTYAFITIDVCLSMSAIITIYTFLTYCLHLLGRMALDLALLTFSINRTIIKNQNYSQIWVVLVNRDSNKRV